MTSVLQLKLQPLTEWLQKCKWWLNQTSRVCCTDRGRWTGGRKERLFFTMPKWKQNCESANFAFCSFVMCGSIYNFVEKCIHRVYFADTNQLTEAVEEQNGRYAHTSSKESATVFFLYSDIKYTPANNIDNHNNFNEQRQWIKLNTAKEGNYEITQKLQSNMRAPLVVDGKVFLTCEHICCVCLVLGRMRARVCVVSVCVCHMRNNRQTRSQCIV